MHLVPGVDDGSRSLEESTAMLRRSARQGVSCAFATPHSFAFKTSPERVRDRFERLKRHAEQLGLPVRLFLGCEIRVEPETADACAEKLKTGRYPTLGNSRYALLEFDPFLCTQEDAEFCAGRFVSAGFVPVIAHAERYRFTSVAGTERLREAGARIQINAYSIVNERAAWIRENANALLAARLVDQIGTDAHRMDHRPPLLDEGIEALCRQYTEAYAEKICILNPRLLEGDAD